MVTIAKIDEDRRLVFGWASVAADGHGAPLVDTDDEMIAPEELETAVYEYMREAPVMGERHEGEPVGHVVESLMMTPEKAAAMGLAAPPVTGWWIGCKIDDPAVFAKVKSGEYSMLSIQGTALRDEITA